MYNSIERDSVRGVEFRAKKLVSAGNNLSLVERSFRHRIITGNYKMDLL